MLCPQCGYDIGHKNKCLRCGYEIKTLVVSDEEKEQKHGQKEEDDTIYIDPMNVFLTHPYGYEDDYGTGYNAPIDDPFVSIIDSLFGGDPFADLLGGLFGFGAPRRRVVYEDPPPRKKKKQGPIIVVDDIEIIEPDKEGEKKDDASTDDNASDQDAQTKNIFKRNKNKK